MLVLVVSILLILVNPNCSDTTKCNNAQGKIKKFREFSDTKSREVKGKKNRELHKATHFVYSLCRLCTQAAYPCIYKSLNSFFTLTLFKNKKTNTI